MLYKLNFKIFVCFSKTVLEINLMVDVEGPD